MRSLLSSFFLLLLFIGSWFHVFADVDDTGLGDLQSKISSIQAVTVGLPSGVPEPKWKIGYIIAKMFNGSSRISNSVIKAIAFTPRSTSTNKLLRWIGWNGGHFVDSIIYDTGTQIGIGATPSTGSLMLDVTWSIGASEYCDEDGENCFSPSTVALSGSTVGGTGTTGYVTKFTGTSTLGNSIIRDNGSQIGIGWAPSQQLHTTGTARFDGWVLVDGRVAISATNHSHTARATDDAHYGYFEMRRDDNLRWAYLGYGNGTTQIQLNLDNADQLRINGGVSGTNLLQVDWGATFNTAVTDTDFVVTDSDKWSVSNVLWYDYSAGKVLLWNTGGAGASAEVQIRGQLQLDEEGTAVNHVVTKAYVDAAVSGGWADNLWNHSGSTTLDMNNNFIQQVKWLFLGWSPTYGTQFNHGIFSHDGTVYSDDLLLNSYGNVRINLDSNNNDAAETFEIWHHTIDGSSNTLFTIKHTGNIGIGITNPKVKLQIDGGSDASLADGSGYFIINNENSTNLVMDNNEIMARNNGAKSMLNLNVDGWGLSVHNGQAWGTQFIIEDGGNVGIGISTPLSPLHIGNSPDISSVNDKSAGLLIENTAGDNFLALDTNEMQTHNGTTATNFAMQPYGGAVGIGWFPNTVDSAFLDVAGNIRISGGRTLIFWDQTGLNKQSIYGDNSSAFYFDSSHDTASQIIFRDDDNTQLGSLYVSEAYIGLRHGNNEWWVVAYEDSYTQLYNNNSWKLRTHASGIIVNGMIDAVTCVWNCF